MWVFYPERIHAGQSWSRHVEAGAASPFHSTRYDPGGGYRDHVHLPGEVSLAHHGLLLLDEVLKGKRPILEVLRPSLEKSVI
jgi:predicted ATPase with chaperone activity